ncbi:MAG TPA: hypothetical protein VF796_24755, partial [Humisphaera sp.]
TLVRPARHAVAGAWTLGGQGLSAELGAAAGLVALPVWPGKTYDLSVRFQSHGAAAVGVTVPVGPGAVTVLREATGLSLSAVAGAAVPMSTTLTDVAKDNETRTLLVRVGDAGDGLATVTVLVDGAQVGQWHGRTADLQPAAGAAAPVRSAVAFYARGGHPLFVDASVRCYAGGPPLALAVPGPADLTWDGTPPRDAVADAPTATSARFAHHGATAVFDKALPGGVQVTVADPGDDVRLLRVGLPKMVAAPTALAPLGVDYVRYQRLVAMSRDVPRFAADADLARLRDLFAQRESGPPGSDVRVRAEWAIHATLHQVAGTYRRGAAAWAQAMQRALSPGEYELAKKMGAS